jgi:hypothetical protein
MSHNKRFLKYVPIVAGVALVVIVAGGMVYFIASMEDAPKSKKMVQQISLIQPPPPPPPPKIEKPPEPEIEEEVKVDEPETPEELPDMPSDEPPPGDMLGLDADGGAGGDAFGLIGKKGGRSLLGGGGGSEFAWYTGKLQSHVENTLYDLTEREEFREIRQGRYSIRIKVWIDDDLNLRGKLVGSTGDPERDKKLRQALANLGQIDEAAPANMAQPIRLKIISRI